MTTGSIAFEWQVVGDIVLAGGLGFPDQAPIPGVYRIAVGKEVYIGEADNLHRAMRRFRLGHTSQGTNKGVHDWLRGTLGGGAGQLAVVRFDPAMAREQQHDLTRVGDRRRIKAQAIDGELRAGSTMANLRWLGRR